MPKFDIIFHITNLVALPGHAIYSIKTKIHTEQFPQIVETFQSEQSCYVQELQIVAGKIKAVFDNPKSGNTTSVSCNKCWYSAQSTRLFAVYLSLRVLVVLVLNTCVNE